MLKRLQRLILLGIFSITVLSTGSVVMAADVDTPAAEQTEVTETPEEPVQPTETPNPTEAPAEPTPEPTAEPTVAPTATPTPKETKTDNTSGSSQSSESSNTAQDSTLHTVTQSDTTSVSNFTVDTSNYEAANINDNTILIYQYLTSEMGLNHAGACGVLANIQCESNFSPLSLGDGGTSYGICQWHNGRFNNLISYCNGNGYDYNTVNGQLHYLQYELTNNYPSVLEYIKNVPDTAQGSYDAAYYWCMHFEVPNHTEERSAQRGNIAMNEYYGKSFETENSDTDTISEIRDQLDTKCAVGDIREQINTGNIKDRLTNMRISNLTK